MGPGGLESDGVRRGEDRRVKGLGGARTNAKGCHPRRAGKGEGSRFEAQRGRRTEPPCRAEAWARLWRWSTPVVVPANCCKRESSASAIIKILCDFVLPVRPSLVAAANNPSPMPGSSTTHEMQTLVRRCSALAALAPCL